MPMSDAWRAALAEGGVPPTNVGVTASDSSYDVLGLQAAQGGAITVTGGVSTTDANAGGAVTVTGGTPGVTGVGGAVTVVAGAGGATSGNGGVASATGGAGTAGNGVGGVAKVHGGAGQGSGAGGAGEARGGLAGTTGVGGAVNLVAGAGGATSGKGGAVNVTGGAGTAGNGPGGSIILTPGAKHGSGLAGGTFRRSATGMHFMQRAVAVAKTDAAAVMTAAEMINGIVVHTISTGRTLTTPTGAELSAGCPSDLAVGDCFELTVVTVGTGSDDISTLTAGATGVTLVGAPTVGPNIQATEGLNCWGNWIFQNTAADTWIGYRNG